MCSRSCKQLKDNKQCQSDERDHVLSWSPLPNRKKLYSAQEFSELQKSQNGFESLYPNYDSNIWLRSCKEEILIPQNGHTKGCIPQWLNGSLIRNGPGSIKIGNDEFAHLFDCPAFLHRFGIKNGTVTYQSRFLKTEVYKKNFRANRIVMTQFGTKAISDPCRSVFERVSSVFSSDPADNSMVSVYPLGDKFYAFGEAPIIHQINPNTLETEGRKDLRDNVSIVHHSSHPHIENNGAVYSLGLSVHKTKPSHTIVQFPKNKEGSSDEMFKNAKIVASVQARWSFNPSYMHTFGITDDYFIIVEQPFCLSVPAMVGAKLLNDPFINCFRWYNDEYTRITVVSRKTGKPCKTFYAEKFCYFHIINQYVKENHIVIDICIYKDSSIVESMYIEALKTFQQNPNAAKMMRARAARFVLPLNPEPVTVDESENLVKLKNSNARAYYLTNGDILVKPDKLSDIGCEMPGINYKNYRGKPYRYFYAIGIDIETEASGSLIKVDTETKSTKLWLERDCYPSEPVFVPSPNSKNEDDGLLLSVMVWGGERTNQVGLLVLDAKSMLELGRVEFETSTPVPASLHGWFLPTDK